VQGEQVPGEIWSCVVYCTSRLHVLVEGYQMDPVFPLGPYYSAECVEGLLCELRTNGVLGSCAPRRLVILYYVK